MSLFFTVLIGMFLLPALMLMAARFAVRMLIRIVLLALLVLAVLFVWLFGFPHLTHGQISILAVLLGLGLMVMIALKGRLPGSPRRK